MASTWQIQGYVALARREAVRMSAAHGPIVEAILVQWQCEQPAPAPWPPVHNNPGNLTRNIGSLGGPPPPVATTPPGAGLLYRYPNPTAGADAYANYLLRSTRYRSAIMAARRGDAMGFLTGVCTSGYGTRLSCCAALMRRVSLPAPSPALPRWLCTADAVRVRSHPSITAAIVGHNDTGARIVGALIHGGAYTAGGHTRTDWIAEGSSRYTAAAYYRRA